VKKLNSKSYSVVYLGILLVVFVASVIFISLRNYYQRAQQAFDHQADQVREQIAKRIGMLEQITHVLASEVPSQDIEGDEFAENARSYLEQNPEIAYIAYVQRIEQADREQFEERMRSRVSPSFTIVELARGDYQSARIRDQYFSFRDIQPYSEKMEQVIGLDINANAVYRNAVLKSLQSGQLVVVQALPMTSDTVAGFVMLDLARQRIQSNSIHNNPWAGVDGAILLKVNINQLLASIEIPETWHLSTLDERGTVENSGLIPQQLQYQFSPQLNGYRNRVLISLQAPLKFDNFVASTLIETAIVVFALLLFGYALLKFFLQRNDNLLAINHKVQALVEEKTKQLEEEKVLLRGEIEERHRLEKQAIYFGRILDQTSNEIYMFSTETLLFVKVNQGALRNLGYSMEEMRHKTPYDIKPDFEKDSFCQAIQPLVDGRQNRLVFETRHQRKDGSCYPVEVRLQIVQGEEAIFVAVIEDISVRQKTSDKMRKLSIALESSRDIVLVTDPDGVIEYVNPAFESSTGYKSADAIGRKPSLLNSFKQDDAYYKQLWETISKGEQYHGILINRKKSGELYYEEKTITPIRNESGAIISYVSTGRDITEREMARQQMQEKNKQLEMEIIERESVQAELRKHRAHLSELVDQRTLELARARDEAIEANSAKTRFLMSMSHELRTPLNAIIGYSELIKEEMHEDGLNDYIDDIEKITLSGNHLLGLINDLLDLSRVEAGKLELENAEFSLSDLLKSVEYAVQPLMSKNRNRFVIHKYFEQMKMVGDVKRVRQVLVNLVANAGKFTEQGEVVLQANICSGEKGDWMVFRIKDTGIGIAQEKIIKLFQEFSQADENIAMKYGGSGLGLAISKKLCETMGGSIAVESEVDRGSVFTVTLPFASSLDNEKTLLPSAAVNRS